MKGKKALSIPIQKRNSSNPGRRKRAEARSGQTRLSASVAAVKAQVARKAPLTLKAAARAAKPAHPLPVEVSLPEPVSQPEPEDLHPSRRNWSEEAFRKGQYAGGNGLIDALLPQDHILPDIPIEDILAEGIEQYRSQMLPLLSAEELGGRLKEALLARTPMSVVRLGEGELLLLAQETVLPLDQLQAEKPLLERKRINLPDLKARDMLLDSLTRASVVGVPRTRARNGLPLFYALARGYHLDVRSLPLADSRLQYELHRSGVLSELINGRKVLLIGERSEPLAAQLRIQGAKIGATFTQPVHFKDVPGIVQQAKRLDFDLALVAAGASSVVLTERIARDCGRVALDIGYLADTLANKEAASP